MKVWMSLFSLKKSLWRYLTYQVRWRMLKSVVKCFQVYTVCLNRLIRIIIWKTSDFKLISPIRIWKWPFSWKNDWISCFFLVWITRKIKWIVSNKKQSRLTKKITQPNQNHLFGRTFVLFYQLYDCENHKSQLKQLM